MTFGLISEENTLKHYNVTFYGYGTKIATHKMSAYNLNNLRCNIARAMMNPSVAGVDKAIVKESKTGKVVGTIEQDWVEYGHHDYALSLTWKSPAMKKAKEFDTRNGRC